MKSSSDGNPALVESPGFATGYAIERILESRSENIKLKNKNSLLFLCSVFFSDHARLQYSRYSRYRYHLNLEIISKISVWLDSVSFNLGKG